MLKENQGVINGFKETREIHTQVSYLALKEQVVSERE